MKPKIIVFICLLIFCNWFYVSSQSSTTSSITQYNITWTFDSEYEYGQFVNGDYWVIGPVVITSISPGWDGEKNGSMINPDAIDSHGYDSRDASFYNPDLNAGLISNFPMILYPDTSLITTIGLEESHSNYGRTYLRAAAVLTVLETPPPDDAFRPPYTVCDKPILRFSDIESEKLNQLPDLAPVSSTPDIADITAKIQGVWLEHMAIPYSQHIHPVENMPAYGQNMAEDIGDAALMLMVDNTDDDLLLKNFLQLGIDLYYVAKRNNSLWLGGGGQSSGRKWPILFAAVMFNHTEMLELIDKSGDYIYENGYGPGNLPPDYIRFGEDDQTFYVSESDIYSKPYEVNCHGGDTYKNEGFVDVVHGSNIVQGHGTAFESDDLMTGIMDGRDVRTNFAVVGTTALTDPSEDWNNPSGKSYYIDSIDVINQRLILTEVYRGTTQNNMGYKVGTGVASIGWLWYGHGYSPGTYQKDYIEYTDAHLGLPEWGNIHSTDPNQDGYDWRYSSYRRCCTATVWAGQILSALIMEEHFSTKTLWQHNALFDYQDRYMQIEEAGDDGEGDIFVSGLRQESKFAEEMWDTYRANYGTVWTPSETTNEKIIPFRTDFSSDISMQPYPNPYNLGREQKIIFLVKNKNSMLSLYNIKGELIQNIRSNNSNKIVWDGKNESGQEVSPGIYLYIIIDNKGITMKGKIAVIH